MSLHEFLDILRRRWLIGSLVAVGVIGVVMAVSFTMTPRYTSTARLFFAVEGTDSVSDLAQGSSFTEKQVMSYAQVATSPLVLDPVITDLSLETTPAILAKSLTADVLPNTVILEISFTGTDPVLAADITNAITAKLAAVTENLSPEREDGAQSVKATILAPAQPADTPSSPKIPRNLAIGLVLGLVLGVGVALLRNILDTKIRNDRDVRAITDKPLLGSIAQDDKITHHPVIVADEPLSAASEAIRRLRTNLQFIDTGDIGDTAKVIVVTSSIPGEGKSTTAVNLAVALATAGTRVLLIDADLRRPAVADTLGMEGRAGLTTVLIGKADAPHVIQQWRDTTLDILAAGQVPPNPSELLGSQQMRRLLADLSASFDIILLDSPPLLPVTDATILTKLAHGALIVVGADRIHRAQLAQSLTTLRTADATVFGTVLNKIARRDASPYVYRAGYYQPADPPPKITPTVQPSRAGTVEPNRAD